MTTRTYYKATRVDGTSFHDGKTAWKVGRITRHPKPGEIGQGTLVIRPVEEPVHGASTGAAAYGDNEAPSTTEHLFQLLTDLTEHVTALEKRVDALA